MRSDAHSLEKREPGYVGTWPFRSSGSSTKSALVVLGLHGLNNSLKKEAMPLNQLL